MAMTLNIYLLGMGGGLVYASQWPCEFLSSLWGDWCKVSTAPFHGELKE